MIVGAGGKLMTSLKAVAAEDWPNLSVTVTLKFKVVGGAVGVPVTVPLALNVRPFVKAGAAAQVNGEAPLAVKVKL